MTGMLRMRRSRGVLSGFLLVLLGLWGGLIAFILFLARTTLGKFTPAQATAAIVVSYYWHFVDVVWIGLFAVIYLIR